MAKSALQNIGIGCDEPICQPEDLGLLLEQIDYKVDMLGCIKTPITSADIASGTISLTSAGSYCLSTDLTSDLIIAANCISVDLNNRILTGRVIVQTADNVIIQDGHVVPAAPTTSGDASQAGITITTTALRSQIKRVNVRCENTATADVVGRAGIEIQGNDAQIIECTVCAGDAGDSSTGAAPDGGDAIQITSNAERALISGCILKTGAGGDSSVNVGGNGGHGVNVSDSTETKILKTTILQTGAGGMGSGGFSGGIGGHGVNVQDAARKTMITQLIIRDTGISGLPESMIDVPTAQGASVTIPLRSRAINDLIPTSVSGISTVFANNAYRIYDSARPYIFQSALDTLGQGNPAQLPPLANEKSGMIVTGWSPISNVVFQSAIEQLAS